MRRQVNLADLAVGFVDVADAKQAQLLRQPTLQRAEHALAPPTRLRRVGRDMLDAEVRQRPPYLGQLLLVDRLAGPRGEEVMAAAVGVEARRQAVHGEHLKKCPER